MKTVFRHLPVWVRWGVIPVIALLLFGSVIMSVLGFLVSLLFKVLLFVAFVAAVVFVVKALTARTAGK